MIRFLKTTWTGDTKDVPQTTKSKLFSWPAPKWKENEDWLSCWFLESHSWELYQSLFTNILGNFKLYSVQQKTLKKFQTLRLRAHSVYSLGWYNSNAQIIRSVSPLHSGCWEHFAKAHVCNPAISARILE